MRMPAAGISGSLCPCFGRIIRESVIILFGFLSHSKMVIILSINIYVCVCVCVFHFESRVVLFLNTSFIYGNFYPDNKHPEDLYDTSLSFQLGCRAAEASLHQNRGLWLLQRPPVLRLQKSFGKILAP